jgi:hypothetical protein
MKLRFNYKGAPAAGQIDGRVAAADSMKDNRFGFAMLDNKNYRSNSHFKKRKRPSLRAQRLRVAPEAIQSKNAFSGLLRRYAPRNDVP